MVPATTCFVQGGSALLYSKSALSMPIRASANLAPFLGRARRASTPKLEEFEWEWRAAALRMFGRSSLMWGGRAGHTVNVGPTSAKSMSSTCSPVRQASNMVAVMLRSYVDWHKAGRGAN